MLVGLFVVRRALAFIPVAVAFVGLRRATPPFVPLVGGSVRQHLRFLSPSRSAMFARRFPGGFVHANIVAGVLGWNRWSADVSLAR